MGASLKCLSGCAAEGDASAARTVVHLIVGPARDERCVVLSLSCGARLRPGYPQHYCTLRMPVARPAWRYRRSCRPAKRVVEFVCPELPWCALWHGVVVSVAGTG